MQKNYFLSKLAKKNDQNFDDTLGTDSLKPTAAGGDLESEGNLNQASQLSIQAFSALAQSQKKQKIIVGKNEKNQAIYGDDFAYYTHQKSYNVLLPKKRRFASNHPYLMVEPSLYIDFSSFNEPQRSQSQLMYFFNRGVVDYQGHLMLKDSCQSLQDQVLQELPLQEKRVYERLFELNNNYWHSLTECEKRMYEVLVDTEKEVTLDVLVNILNANFDLNAQLAANSSDKVNLSKEFPPDTNYYFFTSNTGVQNNKIYSDNLAQNQNEPMNVFSGQFDTVQNLKDPTYPNGNYDSDYRTPQINFNPEHVNVNQNNLNLGGVALPPLEQEH